RSTSHSSGGTTGDSMSPTISMTPLRQPKMSLGGVSGGTSLATGLPFLVIVTGSRVFCTSSITFKHRALNWAAGIVFMTTPDDHSHYNMTPHDAGGTFRGCSPGEAGLMGADFAGGGARAPRLCGLPFILRSYGSHKGHCGNCKGDEHHAEGDVLAHRGGELSRRARAPEGRQVPGALSRSARAAARRERPGEVRGLLPVRGSVSFELHLYRGGGEHDGAAHQRRRTLCQGL